MPMNGTYLDAIATHGKSLITHIGLVDNTGAELTGGSPAYARKPVTWTGPSAGDGLFRPAADLDFDIPGSRNVAGWRGYSALTAGTDYGGAALTQETYAAQGTYKLLAASTAVDHNAV